MFSNLLALKLEYAMSVYQKFRDCKTAGPCLGPCMIFARVWASHAHRAWQISFSPSLQMFRFSVGSCMIYVKIRAELQAKKFHFSGRQFIQLTLIPLTDT